MTRAPHSTYSGKLKVNTHQKKINALEVHKIVSHPTPSSVCVSCLRSSLILDSPHLTYEAPFPFFFWRAQLVTRRPRHDRPVSFFLKKKKKTPGNYINRHSSYLCTRKGSPSYFSVLLFHTASFGYQYDPLLGILSRGAGSFSEAPSLYHCSNKKASTDKLVSILRRHPSYVLADFQKLKARKRMRLVSLFADSRRVELKKTLPLWQQLPMRGKGAKKRSP